MNNDKEPVHRTGSRLLLLSFLMITISVIIVAIELAFILGSYLHLLEFSYSPIENLLLSVSYSLATPLVVVGVALLLMFLTRAKKGMAIRSRLIFLLGAVLFIAGGLFSIASQWVIFSSGNLIEADFELLNQLGIIGSVASILGTLLCAIATLLLVRSYLKGEISGNRGFERPIQSNKESWTDAFNRPIITLFAVLVALVIILASISIIFWHDFSREQAALPVHDGDNIVWSVNGTRNGQNVSGVSTWTFHDVKSHPSIPYPIIYSAYKYDISISTELNGIANEYETAGAFDNPKLWSLGINPTVLSEGHSGYYNGGSQVFQSIETISTANGQKATAIYLELYNNNSNDMWSKMWIDFDTGMPYKIQMTEPVTLNGYPNDFSGTLTFQMLTTSIPQ
jgi:hypothetical protein